MKFESLLPSVHNSIALDSCDYDDSISCDTLHTLSPRHVEQMNTLSSGHCDSTNFISAYGVSAISFATDIDQTDIGELKCSSVIYEDMPTLVLQECFNIWDIPRPEPEGLQTKSSISMTPNCNDFRIDSSMDDDCDDDCDDDLMHYNRDSYMEITMYNDEHSVAPTNSPITPRPAPMDTPLGSRPQCIGQEAPLLSPTSASDTCSDENNAADATQYEPASSPKYVLKAKRYMDKSMCSDVSAFMNRPLCRRGVVKESKRKLPRHYKRSITQKFKNIGKKLHGFASAQSLPTLAVL